MALNAKNVKSILSKNILADGFEPIIDLDKSHGSWIIDQRDGKEALWLCQFPVVIEGGEYEFE